MFKTASLLFSFFLFTLTVSAQEEIGLNPPSIEWRQIDAPAGRVIFPKGLDSLAFRAAGIMAWQQRHDSSLVGTGRTKRIPTILQNQSAMPAGFSTPAPWRNEFYITPPQNLFAGPTLWLTYLTTHEYRHSQQFHMANQGVALPFKILLGQTGWAAECVGKPASVVPGGRCRGNRNCFNKRRAGASAQFSYGNPRAALIRLPV
ncbi:hypothetical protein [Pontibacter chitinilyticus]|uniref:hypothetical protein n=1 Tax=Pontibacter chitinilyticus TaxID=2674989 RepID=UPI00321BAAA3